MVLDPVTAMQAVTYFGFVGLPKAAGLGNAWLDAASRAHQMFVIPMASQAGTDA